MLTRTLAPPPDHVVVAPVEPLVPGGSSSACQQREISSLSLHLARDHPEVSLAAITSMVEDEHAALAQAPVQGFRMILTERAVRRRLALQPDQEECP